MAAQLTVKSTAIAAKPKFADREAPKAHPDPRTIEDAAIYISQMTTEMAAIARAADMKLLAYFLDMARIEANVTARKAVSHSP